MGGSALVTPDQVSIGVLVDAVPRDAVDEAVAACGVRERRSGGKLPAHVVTCLTLALSLFPDDDYEEVATKVTGSLDRFGCWDAAWSVPTASAITQARKRLGREVFPELFERTCGPVAGDTSPSAGLLALGTARGAFLRGWRLLAIDGFELDVPDTPANAAEFGYAGCGENRSAFCKARVVALAECGTHAFLAAEVAGYAVGEKTLAQRLYSRLRTDELLTADRGFYSYKAWDTAAATGAALLWRAPTQLRLPVVRVLEDGTWLTVVMDPAIRGARREAILAAARAGNDLAELPGVAGVVVPAARGGQDRFPAGAADGRVHDDGEPGAVLEHANDGQAQLGRGAPQQRGPGRGGGVPRLVGVEPAVGGEQLVGTKPGVQPLRQRLLPDGVPGDLGGEEGVRAALGQRDHPRFAERGAVLTAAGVAELGGVRRGVGHIEFEPVDRQQPPATQERPPRRA